MSVVGSKSLGWTPAEEARLQSVLGKAIAQSIQSLSSMLGVTASPTSWGLLGAQIKEPPSTLFQRHQETYGIFMRIHGDLVGTCLLCFSIPSAEVLLKDLLQKFSPSDPAFVAGMLQSALEETGNVFFNQYIKTLGDELKIETYPTSPTFEVGPWDKIWSRLALSQLSIGDKLVLLHSDFTWPQAPGRGHFLLCLSQDSWDRLHQWTVQGKSHVRAVGLGGLEVAKAPAVLRASDLGSCVALIVYDSVNKIGGMAHVMLPRAPSLKVATAKPGKYADYALAALLAKMRPMGGILTAWMVGGSDMNSPIISSLGSIGSRNVEALRQDIQQSGLKLKGEDIGGSHARTVELLTETGELRIQWGRNHRHERMA